MKKIIIGFSKPKNTFFPVFSWIIRLFQNTKYSHVFLRFRAKNLKRSLVYEAMMNGVRFIGKHRWAQKAEVIHEYELEIEDESYLEIMRFCVDNSGTGYGMWQNLGVMIAETLKLKKNPFTNGKNCSELIADVLKLEGLTISKEKNLITPKDIENCLNINNIRKIK